MTYKINGTTLTLQPTSGKWVGREVIDISGDGHGVYPAIHQFEIRWGIESVAEANQIFTFFSAIGSTGTVVVELPRHPYTATTYEFYAYSGCVLREPMMDVWFNQHPTEVLLIVDSIRV